MGTLQTIVFFLLLNLTCLPILGQNWLPISPSDSLNYQFPGDLHVSETVWVDSTGMFGSDTVYYLRQVPRLCTTCPPDINGHFPRLKNQAGLLSKEIQMDASGKCLFTDPGIRVLFRLANLNDTWTYDTINNVQATVSRVYTDLLWGTTDSIKTISLSNSDSILLSKNHGLLRFPDADGVGNALIGMHGRDLGILHPTFWDFHAMQVGDQWEIDYSSNAGGTWQDYQGLRATEKHQVISRTRSGDSLTLVTDITYRYQWLFMDQNFTTIYGPVNLGIGQDTLIYVDRPDHLLNVFPPALTPTTHFYADHMIIPNDAVSNLNDTLDGNGQTWREMGYGWIRPGLNAYQDVPSNDTLQTHPGVCNDLLNRYHLGLGPIEFNLFCFEFGENQTLTAFTHNGDTVGTFTPDSTLLVSEEPVITSLEVFPNPVHSQLQVVSKGNTPVEFEIVDLQGRSLGLWTSQGKRTSIDLAEMPEGILFLVVQYGNGDRVVRRVIKQ